MIEIVALRIFLLRSDTSPSVYLCPQCPGRRLKERGAT